MDNSCLEIFLDIKIKIKIITGNISNFVIEAHVKL